MRMYLPHNPYGVPIPPSVQPQQISMLGYNIQKDIGPDCYVDILDRICELTMQSRPMSIFFSVCDFSDITPTSGCPVASEAEQANQLGYTPPHHMKRSNASRRIGPLKDK